MEANEKCDVYSFGVLALEILFGRHPGDITSSYIGVSSTLDDMVLMDMLDERLPNPTSHVIKDVVSIVKTAISCLIESPRSRPTMDQVVKELLTSNSSFLQHTHLEQKD